MRMERTLALVPRRAVDAHVSIDDIAAMIDGRLPESRRAAVEAHLSECSECRAEFVDASTIVAAVPARSTNRARWVQLAAAAVIVIAAIPLIRSGRASSPRDGERSVVQVSSAISTLLPASDSRTPIDSLRFTWRSVPGVATYNVSVTDSVGTPIYAIKTADTAVGPIADLRLAPGARYFWHVDALNSDGSSIKSPQVSFSVRDR